jgi:acetoacetyl-CoA synthetase
MPKKLWEHPDPTNTPMYRFMQAVNERHDAKLEV